VNLEKKACQDIPEKTVFQLAFFVFNSFPLILISEQRLFECYTAYCATFVYYLTLSTCVTSWVMFSMSNCRW